MPGEHFVIIQNQLNTGPRNCKKSAYFPCFSREDSSVGTHTPRFGENRRNANLVCCSSRTRYYSRQPNVIGPQTNMRYHLTSSHFGPEKSGFFDKNDRVRDPKRWERRIPSERGKRPLPQYMSENRSALGLGAHHTQSLSYLNLAHRDLQRNLPPPWRGSRSPLENVYILRSTQLFLSLC